MAAESDNLYDSPLIVVKMSDATVPLSTEILTEEELNSELEKGYEDAKAGKVKSAKEVFENIREDYGI